MNVLVTGATSGIGLETARILASQGHAVWVHGRSEAKAKRAVEDIGAGVPVAADLGSLDAVRALGAAVSGVGLDVVVHNAGVWLNQPSRTVDGFETTWQVNHLAPFLLTALLIDEMLERPAARVVTVSSMGHRSGHLYLDDPNLDGRFSGITAYCQSKLANVVFTEELARRTQGTSLVAHSLHPGVIRTQLLNNTGFGNQPARTPKEGARTSVYVATSEDAGRTSGDYWDDERRVRAKRTDRDVARRLWALSERQTGVTMR